MSTEPNQSIIASDPTGGHAIVLAAKRSGERTFGILCRRHLPKMFAVAMRSIRAPRGAILAAILLLPLLVLVAQQKSSLLIDGPRGQARLIQVQGKNYVKADEVARITGGFCAFRRKSDHFDFAQDRRFITAAGAISTTARLFKAIR
jgi:hypothetical protein